MARESVSCLQLFQCPFFLNCFHTLILLFLSLFNICKKCWRVSHLKDSNCPDWSLKFSHTSGSEGRNPKESMAMYSMHRFWYLLSHGSNAAFKNTQAMLMLLSSLTSRWPNPRRKRGHFLSRILFLLTTSNNWMQNGWFLLHPSRL
jgi:hypothetical protein